MTVTAAPVRNDQPTQRQLYRRQQKLLPLAGTLTVIVIMFAFGAARYENFASAQTILSIFIDQAWLLVVAVGMTFVILTGGIDLSVGAVVALSTIASASLIERSGWNSVLVVLVVLLGGTLLGAAMGAVIHYFEIQPFIVTLAGMFLARGLCYVISTDSISINDPLFTKIAQTPVRLGNDLHLSIASLIAFAVVAVAAYLLHLTRFGRTVYAIGGSEQSATLMGLSVGRTKVTVYAISGFCSALGGILLSLYTLSGYSLNAVGAELDAIAAVVIGGTLLAGGSGYVLGTVLGVVVLGMIQTLIVFDGTLSSWWQRMFVGALLFAFILLQKVITIRRT